MAWKVLWDEGRRLVHERRYQEAVLVYGELLRLRPDLEVGQWELTQLDLLLGEEDKAIALLNSLLDLAPGRKEYLAALAALLEKRGNSARAAELRKRILGREPGDVDALAGLGGDLLLLGKKEEALPVLEKLYALRPAREGLRLQLAELYCQLSMFAQARPLLVALAQGPNPSVKILQSAARTHHALGLDGIAVGYWQKLLGRDPENSEARAALTTYYLQDGRGEEALPFLLPLLAKEPDRPDLMKRIGQIYLGLTRFAEALPFFERYVELRPEDREVLRLVVDIHAALGNKSASLAVMDRFLAVEPEPDLAHLKKAATLYGAGGRYQEAIALYDRILAVTPDDPEILALRAKNLLAAGNAEDAQAMWDHLARRQKLLTVLEVMHRQEPGNLEVTGKLAAMYLERGALQKSLAMFDLLAAAGLESPAILTGHAMVYERLGWSGHALTVYERILQQAGGMSDIRLRIIRLAGELGLLVDLRKQVEFLQAEAPELWNSDKARLAVAGALATAGDYAAARGFYEPYLASPDPELRRAALFGLARVYQAIGLPYEAEQWLRQAYLLDRNSKDALLRLFGIVLDEEKFEDAAFWLDELGRISPAGSGRNSVENGAPSFPELQVLRVRLLVAQGEVRKALPLAHRLRGTDSRRAEASAHAADRELRLLHAGTLFAAERFAEAEEVVREFLTDQPDDLAGLVLLARLHLALARSAAAEEVFARCREAARKDGALQLRLLHLLQEAGLAEQMLHVAGSPLPRLSGSFALRFFVFQAHALNHDWDQAIKALGGLVRSAANAYPKVLLAHCYYNAGQLDRAGDALAAAFDPALMRPDLLLLKARLLWFGQQRADALAVYEKFLVPDIESRVASACRQKGVAPPPSLAYGLWDRLTVPRIDRQTVVDEMMQPVSLGAAGKGGGYAEVAASLYARYRWQQRFSLELAARNALEKREYLGAKKLFSRLVNEYPADASLSFELAGIFSRLGQLDEEAALYDDMQSAGWHFPGLPEARERNRLKRRPRIALGYGYLKEEGRDGYKAIRKSWQEAVLHYSPMLQHEFDLSLTRLEYNDPAGTSKVRGSRTEASYAAQLNDYLQLALGGGAEWLESGMADTALLHGKISGRFGDRLSGGLGYRRDINHDTIAALGRHIVQQEFRGDLQLDLLPNLLIGGSAEYTDYSDTNKVTGYDLWASYLLFWDPAFLKLTYTYDYKDADEGPQGGIATADGFAVDDHPYWAPVNYWQNRFSLLFRHQFSDDHLKRGVPRYYDLEYTVAYDSRGYANQSWRGGFFIEWTPHVILSATMDLTSGQEYRAREFFLSATYRW